MPSLLKLDMPKTIFVDPVKARGKEDTVGCKSSILVFLTTSR